MCDCALPLCISQVYLNFLSVFSIFNISFINLFRVDCVQRYTYHAVLYTVSTCAFLLVLLNIVFATGGGRMIPSQIKQLLTLLAFFCYPSVSALLFMAGNCHEIDGQVYLRADYSIMCNSDQHQTASQVAASTIVFFSFGIPIGFTLILGGKIAKLGGKARAFVWLDRLVLQRSFHVRDYKLAHKLRIESQKLRFQHMLAQAATTQTEFTSQEFRDLLESQTDADTVTDLQFKRIQQKLEQTGRITLSRVEHKLDDVYLELYGENEEWGDGKVFLSVLCKHFHTRSPDSSLAIIEMANLIQDLEIVATADVKRILGRLKSMQALGM
jgi:hypothetical protein